MQAMIVTKLNRFGVQLFPSRWYLDGKRVTRDKYNAAHLWRTCDSFTNVQTKHRDGTITNRSYHSIRVQS